MDPDSSGWRPRRASIANGHIAVVAAAVEEIKKSTNIPTHTPPSRREERHRGEGDHARLVNEACMHIAAAAAAAAAQAVNSGEEEVKKGQFSSSSRNSSVDRTKQMFKNQRKKRRGGILGFKELAAKAGLSPWHFHRVFRSVTGLTPKAYGDACWNTVTSSIPPSTLLASQNQVASNEEPYQLPSRSMSSSAVNDIFQSNPVQFSHSVASNPLFPETSLSSVFNPHPSRSSSTSVMNSPMVYPNEFAMTTGRTTPTSFDMNGIPFHQQQFYSVPYITPFVPHHDHNVSMQFTLPSDSHSVPATLPQQQHVNPLTSHSSIDSLPSVTSSQSMDPHDPLAAPMTATSGWSMGFMNGPMVPMQDFGMGSLNESWIEENSKQMNIPPSNQLLHGGVELEPTLSMMHIGDAGITHGGEDLTLTQGIMMTMPPELPLASATPLQQEKNQTQETKSRSTGTLYLDDVSQGSSSESSMGMQGHSEPWMASRQPMMESTDTVKPLLT